MTALSNLPNLPTTQLPRDAEEPPPGPPAPPRSGGGRRRIITITVAAVLAVVLAVWIVAFSPVLGASTVKVRGLHYLTADEVRSAAKVSKGEPLVRLDAGAIARRIERLPAVASVKVHPSYPNTVVIEVTERVAVGYVEDGSRFVLVDHDGRQFRDAPQRPAKLPLFAVPSGPQATPSAAAIATVAGALPAALLARVSSIRAFDPSSITLVLRDQRIVTWGSAERSADKATILPTLLRQPGTQFDVSNPDQVVVR